MPRNGSKGVTKLCQSLVREGGGIEGGKEDKNDIKNLSLNMSIVERKDEALLLLNIASSIQSSSELSSKPSSSS